jgi:hypothetical protein
MSTDRDVTRIVRSWLEEGASALPDRVLDTVLDQLPATPQRRARWPARRFGEMNNFAKFAIAAAAVALVAFVGLRLLPGQGSVGSVPSPSASPASSPSTAPPSPIASPSTSNGPATFPEGSLEAGTYTVAPFTAAGEGMCHAPPQAGCTETTADDTIRFTVTVPDGWSGIDRAVWLEENKPPSGAALGFGRGGWLLSDPCKYIATDVPVGPTVADFVDAVAEHPILDTTAPVDVTLAGYAGKYFDLQVPADISMCEGEPGNPSSGPIYRPWEPGIYAQGPGHRWHLWALDVEGVRVVVQSMDYTGTSEQRRTELQAIVDSVQIAP